MKLFNAQKSILTESVSGDRYLETNISGEKLQEQSLKVHWDGNYWDIYWIAFGSLEYLQLHYEPLGDRVIEWKATRASSDAIFYFL